MGNYHPFTLISLAIDYGIAGNVTAKGLDNADNIKAISANISQNGFASDIGCKYTQYEIMLNKKWQVNSRSLRSDIQATDSTCIG